MKNKTKKEEGQSPSPKGVRQNPISQKKSIEKPKKLPNKMGYHGSDDEKNLNPEE